MTATKYLTPKREHSIFEPMRKARFIGSGTCYYHVMSRIIEHRYALGDDEKAVFRDMMRRVAAFSGVKVLTYALMDNHFHMLVQVPEREEVAEMELVRRLRLLYQDDALDVVMKRYERIRESGSEVWLQQWMQGYTYRMYDLSEFMKSLKLRFSKWYNVNHEGRQGTLWNERFRSVLVEPLLNVSGREALAMVAAYIELNAVRAGVVEDPLAYAWCGVSDAQAGCVEAREGIGHLMASGNARNWLVWRKMLKVYCSWWDEGVLKKKKRAVLGRRIHSFSYGVVLGRRAFVERVMDEMLISYKAHTRWCARNVSGEDRDDLCAMQ